MGVMEGRQHIVTLGKLFDMIEQGYGFSISHRFESVGAGASVNVYFENPTNSGKKVYLSIIEIVSFAQAHVDIYRDNTKTASGTSLTPQNLNLESANTSAVAAEYGGTYTTGTLSLNTICPGGSAIRAVGGAAEVGELLIIPAGKNILVSVTNKSSSAADLSIRILWWEE